MNLRNYAVVTGAYWAFTVTDGALRMLVLLHFHELGYSPVAIAFLFLVYEAMGVVTNLVGGWVGARRGLNRTLVAGLGLQVVVLLGLSFHDPGWGELASVGFVMGLQALSGVAKDLTKMSSKSAVKFVAGEGRLFELVAVLTGSKNALKGVGFFVGGALLSAIGYDGALWLLAALVGVALVTVLVLIDDDIGRSTTKPTLAALWSKSTAINRLSMARFFLFGSRDIWFVVALPVFCSEVLGWSHTGVGGFMAAWVIGYGVVQSVAPRLVGSVGEAGRTLARWALALAGVTAMITTMVAFDPDSTMAVIAVVGGLVVFGLVFAVNSSVHSYLILAFSQGDGVVMDVGFYYSANAAGRLVGTLLSGVLYLWGGLPVAMVGSLVFVVTTWLLSLRIPNS